MTTRILPPEEWWRLADTEAADVVQSFSDAARVVVVEVDGVIVGCHVLQPILHAECLWVHPAHRGKAGVARRLWAGVQAEAREHFGVRAFATAAVSDAVERLLDHVGATKLPGSHYMVPVGDR